MDRVIDQGPYTKGECNSQKGRLKFSINMQKNVDTNASSSTRQLARKVKALIRRRRRRLRRQRRDPPLHGLPTSPRPPTLTGSELKMLPRYVSTTVYEFYKENNSSPVKITIYSSI